MGSWTDLRKGWDRDVASSRKRGKAAVVALVGIAAVHAFTAVVALWQIDLLGDGAGEKASLETLRLSDTLFQGAGVAAVGMGLVTGVIFLLWLARTVKTARTLVAEPHLRWTPSQAVWGFFIPFANLVRPYRVMCDLRDRLEPDGVPEPAPRPNLDGAAGYRRIEMKKAPRPGALPRASIGAWWGLYLFGHAISYAVAGTAGTTVTALIANRRVILVSSVVEIGSAVLAVLVVRAIDGRLAERHRRVRHASKEELRAWSLAPWLEASEAAA